MDNLVLISKKNMAKDDIDCELQNENVELARTIFEFERTLYFIKESCKWFFWEIYLFQFYNKINNKKNNWLNHFIKEMNNLNK